MPFKPVNDTEAAASILDTLDTFTADSIVKRLEYDVATSTLPPGMKMPSVRVLGKRLGVAPGTVAKAYRDLCDRGVLSAQTGRGTFVAASRPSIASGRPNAAGWVSEAGSRFPRAALANRWTVEALAMEGIQFIGGYADVHKPLAESFIRQTVASGVATAEDMATLHPADGAVRARDRIAARLSQMMGRDVESDDIILAQGAHALLDMTLRALTRPGDLVLSEHPTYYGALDLFEAHRLEVVPIARTSAGIDLDALATVLRTRSPRLFYFTGSPSNPLGHLLADEQASALLELLANHEIPVVEDSSLWPFQYVERPVTPLFARDRHDQVIHLCSFSKWLFPSLRLAVAIGTSRSFARVRLVNRGVVRISPAYPQFAVAAYFDSPEFPADLARSVGAYREARDVIVAALKRSLPDEARFSEPDGGFTIWIDLPASVVPERLSGHCLRAGVYPLFGRIFALAANEVTGLRVAFGQNPPSALREGAHRLGEAIRLALHRPAPSGATFA